MISYYFTLNWITFDIGMFVDAFVNIFCHHNILQTKFPSIYLKLWCCVTYPVKCIAAFVGNQRNTFMDFIFFSYFQCIWNCVHSHWCCYWSGGEWLGFSKRLPSDPERDQEPWTVNKVEQNMDSSHCLLRLPSNRSTFRSSPRRSWSSMRFWWWRSWRTPTSSTF